MRYLGSGPRDSLVRFDAMDSSDLQRLFEGYMDCFNRGDGPCAAAYYSAPSFVVKDGEVTRFESGEKVAYFTALMEANATSGPHKWEMDSFEVALPAANGAFATVRWIARRLDGSVIWDFKDTYVVVDTRQGWRILGDIVHDAD
jgi:hypothetical protein